MGLLEIPLYIPSAHRADDRLAKSILSQLPEDIVPMIVVPADQGSAYADVLARNDLPGIIHCHAEIGLPNTKRWIANHAMEHHHDKFIIIDDDTMILVRRSSDNWQLRAAEPEDVRKMILWLSMNLEWYEYASVSMREGNNHPGLGDSDELVRFNLRTCRLHAYRTTTFLSTVLDRCELHEDFDTNLQILRSGGTMAVNYWWAHGQRQTNDPGGCSTYRTHQRQITSAKALRDAHPDFVTLRMKENKGDQNGMGFRVDPMIRWKKAWSKGRQLSAENNKGDN